MMEDEFVVGSLLFIVKIFFSLRTPNHEPLTNKERKNG